MPSESLVPDRRGHQSGGAGDASDFGLIETLAFTPAAGFALLTGHMDRLARSSAELGFALDAESAKAALDSAVTGRSEPALRVRLVLWRNGRGGFSYRRQAILRTSLLERRNLLQWFEHRAKPNPRLPQAALRLQYPRPW